MWGGAPCGGMGVWVGVLRAHPEAEEGQGSPGLLKAPSPPQGWVWDWLPRGPAYLNPPSCPGTARGPGGQGAGTAPAGSELAGWGEQVFGSAVQRRLRPSAGVCRSVGCVRRTA